MVAEGVRWLAGFGATMTRAEKATLGYRARRIGLALASFTIGAITGGLAQAHVGYVALLAPIAQTVSPPLQRRSSRPERPLKAGLS